MRLMVVEDNKTNLMILSRLAAQVEGCDVAAFDDPKAALASAIAEGCDMIIVDYLMPDLNGLDLIRAIRGNPGTADVPAVMITSDDDRAVRQAAINAGATDFLTKPVDAVELKTRLRNLLSLRRAIIAEKTRAEWLRQEVTAAIKTIADREEEIIKRMIRAIDCRDGATGAHVDRIAHYSRLIARRVGLPCAEVKDLYLASPMHDVGKLAVPDAILLKPGPLTDAERQIMQRHTTQGHAILSGSQAPLLQKAAEIALSHHERFDGAGYPHGLKGSRIPLSARIVAVADVFDALTSERPYKSAWSIERAKDYVAANAGTQFDPDCVEAFFVGFEEAPEAEPQIATARAA